jgi:hypothetical protein
MPYKTMEGAIVNAMHDSRWANWMWEVKVSGLLIEVVL